MGGGVSDSFAATMGKIFAVIFAVSGLAPASPVAADAPVLSLPAACEPGRTCFVQNHVDLDPGPGVRDYACGAATYDGHKGVDIRLLSAAEAASGVAVLAAAPGIVKGRRDGMADAIAREREAAGLAGRECGNGVVLDHGDGWETQYCHMRQGSIAVQVGDKIARGQPIGEIGYSGLAAFAHLHLSVRKSGAVVDPFSGLSPGDACLAEPRRARGLWDDTAKGAFPVPGALFIEASFTVAVPSPDALEHGGARVPGVAPEGDGLVYFARLMHGRGGDQVWLRVSGPGGFSASSSTTLERDKATWVSSVGRRLTAARWPAGRYEGKAEVVRAGRVVAETASQFDMP